MKNSEYPTWLVTLEIAKELKEIGLDERCLFAFAVEKNDLYLIQREKKDCVWYEDISLLYEPVVPPDSFLVPSWDDTLAWFRAKGYKITFKDINIGTQCAFYHLDINEGHTFSHFAKKYEKAREGLVLKLIEVHKEFGNNIKRFD